MAAAKKAAAQPARDDKRETRAAEVTRRSADGATGTRHEKTFVVARPTLPTQDGPEHDDNKTACVQEAIQRGLHPRGEPRLDGVDDHDDGVTKAFTYSVEVVPAAVDSEPERTTTPRTVVEGGD
ncbi:hypothetical protein [Streptomyces sp. NPDC006784]|uniref:hypothetical protein n=1 Tax=Streptomyces sp. NPDC006784 TaxID=3364764 RepID=UPI003696C869